MSNAYASGPGQYGIFGTAPGSQVGKIRRALDTQPGGVAAQKFGAHPVADISYADIEGLGDKRKFSRWGNQQIRSASDFKSAWYNPMRQQGLVNPLSQSQGMAGIDTAKGAFETYTGGVGGVTGGISASQRLLPAAANIGDRLATAEEGRVRAEELHAQEQEEYDVEEKESKEAFTIGEKEIASQRMQTAEAAEMEYGQAEVATGATGMAYSSAAQEGFDIGQSAQSMRDVATTESELRRGYRKTASGIEGKRTQSEEDLGFAMEAYHSDVQSAYDDASTALDDTMSQLTEIMSYHTDTAGGTGLGGLKGVAGMFTEGGTDVAGYGQTRTNIDTAEAFADAMSAQAGESLRLAREE